MARPKNPAPKVHLSVQVPPDLIALIDGEARRLSDELRVPVNRTVALTRILGDWQATRPKQ